ncbi:hypothetical protein ACWV95_20130 [Streptomyces albus]
MPPVPRGGTGATAPHEQAPPPARTTPPGDRAGEYRPDGTTNNRPVQEQTGTRQHEDGTGGTDGTSTRTSESSGENSARPQGQEREAGPDHLQGQGQRGGEESAWAAGQRADGTRGDGTRGDTARGETARAGDGPASRGPQQQRVGESGPPATNKTPATGGSAPGRPASGPAERDGARNGTGGEGRAQAPGDETAPVAEGQAPARPGSAAGPESETAVPDGGSSGPVAREGDAGRVGMPGQRDESPGAHGAPGGRQPVSEESAHEGPGSGQPGSGTHEGDGRIAVTPEHTGGEHHGSLTAHPDTDGAVGHPAGQGERPAGRSGQDAVAWNEDGFNPNEGHSSYTLELGDPGRLADMQVRTESLNSEFATNKLPWAEQRTQVQRKADDALEAAYQNHRDHPERGFPEREPVVALETRAENAGLVGADVRRAADAYREALKEWRSGRGRGEVTSDNQVSLPTFPATLRGKLDVAFGNRPDVDLDHVASVMTRHDEAYGPVEWARETGVPDHMVTPVADAYKIAEYEYWRGEGAAERGAGLRDSPYAAPDDARFVQLFNEQLESALSQFHHTVSPADIAHHMLSRDSWLAHQTTRPVREAVKGSFDGAWQPLFDKLQKGEISPLEFRREFDSLKDGLPELFQREVMARAAQDAALKWFDDFQHGPRHDRASSAAAGDAAPAGAPSDAPVGGSSSARAKESEGRSGLELTREEPQGRSGLELSRDEPEGRNALELSRDESEGVQATSRGAGEPDGVESAAGGRTAGETVADRPSANKLTKPSTGDKVAAAVRDFADKRIGRQEFAQRVSDLMGGRRDGLESHPVPRSDAVAPEDVPANPVRFEPSRDSATRLHEEAQELVGPTANRFLNGRIGRAEFEQQAADLVAKLGAHPAEDAAARGRRPGRPGRRDPYRTGAAARHRRFPGSRGVHPPERPRRAVRQARVLFPRGRGQVPRRAWRRDRHRGAQLRRQVRPRHGPGRHGRVRRGRRQARRRADQGRGQPAGPGVGGGRRLRPDQPRGGRRRHHLARRADQAARRVPCRLPCRHRQAAGQGRAARDRGAGHAAHRVGGRRALVPQAAEGGGHLAVPADFQGLGGTAPPGEHGGPARAPLPVAHLGPSGQPREPGRHRPEGAGRGAYGRRQGRCRQGPGGPQAGGAVRPGLVALQRGDAPGGHPAQRGHARPHRPARRRQPGAGAGRPAVRQAGPQPRHSGGNPGAGPVPHVDDRRLQQGDRSARGRAACADRPGREVPPGGAGSGEGGRGRPHRGRSVPYEHGALAEGRRRSTAGRRGARAGGGRRADGRRVQQEDHAERRVDA